MNYGPKANIMEPSAENGCSFNNKMGLKMRRSLHPHQPCNISTDVNYLWRDVMAFALFLLLFADRPGIPSYFSFVGSNNCFCQFCHQRFKKWLPPW
jgi:hypothetical protein